MTSRGYNLLADDFPCNVIQTRWALDRQERIDNMLQRRQQSRIRRISRQRERRELQRQNPSSFHPVRHVPEHFRNGDQSPTMPSSRRSEQEPYPQRRRISSRHLSSSPSSSSSSSSCSFVATTNTEPLQSQSSTNTYSDQFVPLIWAILGVRTGGQDELRSLIGEVAYRSIITMYQADFRRRQISCTSLNVESGTYIDSTTQEKLLDPFFSGNNQFGTSTATIAWNVLSQRLISHFHEL